MKTLRPLTPREETVLFLLRFAGRPLAALDLSRRLGHQSSSVAHNALATLQARGLVRVSPSKGFYAVVEE